MKLTFLGCPGAGKGTQAQALGKVFNMPVIVASNVLREYLHDAPVEETIEIRNTMANGGLVSDDIVIRLLDMRLKKPDCENGYIFDGYPRTLAQAKALQALVGRLDAAIYVRVADEIIVERVSGRLICPKCTRTFHETYFPPKLLGICDFCQDKLLKREDDRVETVQNRIKLYHELTEPILGFYRDQDLLDEIDGVGEVDEVTARVLNSLEPLGLGGTQGI